jgi:hypothetical protein
MTGATTLESDALVFFGATGDLAFRQVFPALQALIRRGHFEMPIIGVAKSAMDADQIVANGSGWHNPEPVAPPARGGTALNRDDALPRSKARSVQPYADDDTRAWRKPS